MHIPIWLYHLGDSPEHFVQAAANNRMTENVDRASAGAGHTMKMNNTPNPTEISQGRLLAPSIDSHGDKAYRLVKQTPRAASITGATSAISWAPAQRCLIMKTTEECEP